MTIPDQPGRASSPFLTAAGAVLFVAFVIAGTGMTSFLTKTDPVEVSGLGALPGVLGVALATIVWCVFALRAKTLGGAVVTAAFSAISYVAGLVLSAIILRADMTLAVLGHVVVSWYPVAVAVAGLLAAVLLIVLKRNGGLSAKWPWEHDPDDE